MKKSGKVNSLPEIAQELTAINRELFDHIEELERESVQMKDTPAVLERPTDRDIPFREEIDAALELDWKYTDTVSEQFTRESNLSIIIENFEEEIDSTMALEDAWWADLQTIKGKISRESAAKAELQARVGLLKSQVALVNELHREIHPTEEDMDMISKSLAETEMELKSVTDECNVLSEKLSATQEENSWMESKMSDLQAQASALNSKAEDTGLLRQELSQTKGERDLLDARAREFEHRLEITNNSAEALKSDLETSRNPAHTLHAKVEKGKAQIADLRKQHAAVNVELSHVRTQIDSQVKANRQLEAQVKTLTRNCEAVDTKLSSARKTLDKFQRVAIKFHYQTREVLSRLHFRI